MTIILHKFAYDKERLHVIIWYFFVSYNLVIFFIDIRQCRLVFGKGVYDYTIA